MWYNSRGQGLSQKSRDSDLVINILIEKDKPPLLKVDNGLIPFHSEGSCIPYVGRGRNLGWIFLKFKGSTIADNLVKTYKITQRAERSVIRINSHLGLMNDTRTDLKYKQEKRGLYVQLPSQGIRENPKWYSRVPDVRDNPWDTRQREVDKMRGV